MTNRVVWSTCRMLINIGRRRAVPSPDILEILHYALCPRCRNDIKAQGWRVKFKRKKKKICEVTFEASEVRESRHSEDEEEEDEENEEFKVRRPKRLSGRKKTLKRLKADFYVV